MKGAPLVPSRSDAMRPTNACFGLIASCHVSSPLASGTGAHSKAFAPTSLACSYLHRSHGGEQSQKVYSSKVGGMDFYCKTIASWQGRGRASCARRRTSCHRPTVRPGRQPVLPAGRTALRAGHHGVRPSCELARACPCTGLAEVLETEVAMVDSEEVEGRHGENNDGRRRRRWLCWREGRISGE